MGAVRRRAADCAGRPRMRSPGRPPVGRREHRERFWVAIARGVSSEDAAGEAGVSAAVGVRSFREGGGMPSVSLRPLRGTPVTRRQGGLILDVGGVGYLLQATPRVLRQAEGAAELTIETCLIVREDALQLFGFADRDECELFEQLLSVSGVGPKVALAILSASSPAELRRAIALEDTARFQAIPGVGRKTAQRVVLELKEKLAAGLSESVPTDAGASSSPLVARAALVELGYSIVEAEKALTAVDPELPVEERIRQALKAA